MKAKREIKRVSSKFRDYCKLHGFNASAIKADMKKGKTKVFRYRTPNVYGEMYAIHGDVHCTIQRKIRPSHRKLTQS